MQRLLEGAADDVRRALAAKRVKTPKRGAARERKTRLGHAA
jgi:hypothetical protein